MSPRKTVPTYLVLRVLDAEGESYGTVLTQRTGIPSGTLYPMLDRLDDAGWIESRREEATTAAQGRPLRRYVRLTDTGRKRLAELREKYDGVIG